MSGTGRNRLRFAIVPIVMFAILAPRFMADLFPRVSPAFWLVVAGGVLVAAIVAGVHAWRTARGPHA